MRHWPLADLRLFTPRLELRPPTADDLDALAELAARGVHDPGVMPFNPPWTDVEPTQRARTVLQRHWKHLAEWQPDDWVCGFAVVQGGRVVGLQNLAARNFATVREVYTGSWLAQSFQGRGMGTEMRAAVLHLAFAGLGAESAASSAFDDNLASLRVSRKLGYEPDGIALVARRGEAVTERRLRLSRARWERHQKFSVHIRGLRPCLPLFGVA